VASPEDLQNWPAVVPGLELDGAARQLAENCALESCSPFELRLRIERCNEHLLTDNLKGRLVAAVRGRIGGGINVHFSVTDETLDTAAAKVARIAEDGLHRARETIENDPGVREIVDTFGGEIVQESVRPAAPKD
ncbi:MAG: DNA polymerase III subunit gamma/tau C-terminal domain-containing protein, partial [Gammaproteobacteria bacterium]